MPTSTPRALFVLAATVTAIAAAGGASADLPVSVQPAPTVTAPNAQPISPAPTGLRVTSNGDSQIAMTFACGGHATEHDVWRSTAGGAFQMLAFHPTCQGQGIAIDSSVQPETPYCYYVVAKNSAFSAQSSPMCVTSAMPKAPPATATLTYVTATTRSVTFTIADNSSTEGWFTLVRRAPMPGGPFSFVLKVDRKRDGACGTSGALVRAHRPSGCKILVTDTTVEKGARYEYRVDAGYTSVVPDGGSVVSYGNIVDVAVPAADVVIVPPAPSIRSSPSMNVSPGQPKPGQPFTMTSSICNAGNGASTPLAVTTRIALVMEPAQTSFSSSMTMPALQPGNCFDYRVNVPGLSLGEYDAHFDVPDAPTGGAGAGSGTIVLIQ